MGCVPRKSVTVPINPLRERGDLDRVASFVLASSQLSLPATRPITCATAAGGERTSARLNRAYIISQGGSTDETSNGTGFLDRRAFSCRLATTHTAISPK